MACPKFLRMMCAICAYPFHHQLKWPLPPSQAISVPAVAPQSKGFFDSSRFLYYLIAIALLVACIPLLAFLPGFDVHQWLRN
jgi:hypothetical protein